ncbi:MAG: hypothetical protein IJV23_06765 [Prevotella sp.]|nr:hypothetical protein [Prevotella sp.]
MKKTEYIVPSIKWLAMQTESELNNASLDHTKDEQTVTPDPSTEPYDDEFGANSVVWDD